MKKEIKKGQIIARGFVFDYYEALNDATAGKFVKLAHFWLYEGKDGELKKKYSGEILKKKVYSNYEGVYVSFK